MEQPHHHIHVRTMVRISFHCLTAGVELVASEALSVLHIYFIPRVSQYTPDMSGEEVEKAFRLALKMWSDATPLRFIRVNHGNADIILSFVPRGKPDKKNTCPKNCYKLSYS